MRHSGARRITRMSEVRSLVIMGVSGSGKSTIGSAVAQRLGWSFLDADDFHPADNVAKMSAGEPLTDADRTPWLNILRDVVHSRLEGGESIVLACSALKLGFRDRLLESNGAMLVYLKGDRDLIDSRLKSRRDHFMNSVLLDSQFEALEEPEKAFTMDVGQKASAIVDAIVDEIRPENDGLSTTNSRRR